MSITATERPKNGDPSGVEQHFQSFSVHVHCCHFWRLRAWKHKNLSFPYWRLYWNAQPGAMIFHEDTMVNLHPDMIYLIPPDTPYACFYDPFELAKESDNFCVGGPVFEMKQQGLDGVEHLFIHFNLGLPFDTVKPQLFQISTNSELRQQIKDCCQYTMEDQREFGVAGSLSIITLIGNLLRRLPEDSLESLHRDPRVEKSVSSLNLFKSIANIQEVVV